ncbi:MAG: hypothetical protein ACTHKY_00960 [Ginsengibacter sp.]
MKAAFPFLFFPFSMSAFSQKHKPEIKLCPLCLVDEFSYPTVQAGIDFYLTKELSCYNEIGIKYRNGYYETADTSFIGFGGFKIKTELRYYIALNRLFSRHTQNTETAYYYRLWVCYSADVRTKFTLNTSAAASPTVAHNALTDITLQKNHNNENNFDIIYCGYYTKR